MNKKCLVCSKDTFKTKIKKTLAGKKQIQCMNCKTVYSVNQESISALIPVSIIKISEV